MPGLSDCAVFNNCRLQGLESDLGMTGNDYNVALCLFFITFFCCNALTDVIDTFSLKSLPTLPFAICDQPFTSLL